ncbi:alpha amylase C-terminal domain-containing protein [Citrobacter freundii]|nr:alpha amylase C-terminal domain-containing protein [Citrobacter freundii]MCO5631414.1 alpha amylase C-terminal domain-containing protein [Citrobacter freundii]MCO5636777.1 alpha amylase C-terminal domain-containing protein [Citrobacter freundii]MCO5636781.1 alpha amylase C-terminal domain-containing protein [Citrobacter freundii]MCO5636883.1 alpha amylase C-terminal domain-containing protein [Citrobacter freundii]
MHVADHRENKVIVFVRRDGNRAILIAFNDVFLPDLRRALAQFLVDIDLFLR